MEEVKDIKNQLVIIGIVFLLLAVGLSGCVQRKTPVSEGNVSFSIEDVIITSELEIYNSWTNETKIEVSNDTKFVIISITIENKEDKWLRVQASFQSLTDDEGNTYNSEAFMVEINNSSHSLESLTLINEGESLDISNDISPNSTELKKIVFTIPIDREPERLEVSYGFKPNELANVEKWYHTYLNIPPSIT